MIDRWANRSAWVLKLSNAALIGEFDTLLDIEPRDAGVLSGWRSFTRSSIGGNGPGT